MEISRAEKNLTVSCFSDRKKCLRDSRFIEGVFFLKRTLKRFPRPLNFVKFEQGFLPVIFGNLDVKKTIWMIGHKKLTVILLYLLSSSTRTNPERMISPIHNLFSKEPCPSQTSRKPTPKYSLASAQMARGQNDNSQKEHFAICSIT